MRRSTSHQKLILLIARLILIATAAVVGATVFVVMKNLAEQQLTISLRASLKNRVIQADGEILQAFAKTHTIATRPFLIDQIRIVNTRSDDAAALQALRRGARSFLATGFSAIAMFDREGHKVAQAGHFVHNPAQQAAVNLNGPSNLLYKKGFFLRTTLGIVRNGTTIGQVITDMPLPSLNRMFMDVRQRGKTAELALCAPAGAANMQCFPSTLSHHPIDLSQHARSGEPLPMSYALRGKSGSIVARDYRNKEVVAAFQPVGDLGLGMVLKIDGAELYAPVWAQLPYLLPLLAFLLLLALLSLRWLFTPLVSALVRSEQNTHEANERLRESEKRLRTLLDSVGEGIISIAEDGRIELFNPGAERMFGYRAEDVLDRNVSLLMAPSHRNQHDQYLAAYLHAGGNTSELPTEVLAQRSDGTLFPMELRVSPLELDGKRKFIGIMLDISERKAAEEKIVHLAHHDTLTNLPNRQLTQDRIQQTIARAHRSGTQFAVMFIDLDRFKRVNDTLGHDAGDLLLQEVARRLRGHLRAEDTVGRQGGDEFIVLLDGLSSVEHDTGLVAQKLLDALSEPFVIRERELHISASIGIAIYPQDGTDFESLIKHSDMAMYQAKKAAGKQYRFFAHASGADDADASSPAPVPDDERRRP